ncbi:MAG: phage tail family protein, partial [Oscillospiraceae bacterium]|nr:phage tail family protein [Oscillospiraceae bacterium]
TLLTTTTHIEVGTSALPYEPYVGITKTISLKDTSDNQLEARGIPATYNPDGSVATWAAQDRVFLDSDGFWKFEPVISRQNDLSEDVMALYKSNTTPGYTIFSSPINKRLLNSNLICNILPITNNADAHMTSLSTSQIPKRVSSWTRIVFAISDDLTGVIESDTDVQKIEKFKLWWAENNGELVYIPFIPLNSITLHPDNQTALNEADAAGTFDGMTNIMLSTDLAEAITVEQLKDENHIEFGEILVDQNQTIYYEGDADVGILIVMHAIGEVSNVTIHNTQTHESMKFDTDRLIALTGSGLDAGDTVFIYTVKGDKYVSLLRDGEYINALNCLDKHADWLQLTKGDNVFAYEAESGFNNLEFRIENLKVYEGV